MFPIIEKRHLPIHEQTLPTLLTDLDNRGMLDDTLVCGWASSAGRRRSTRTSAATTGRSATRPCWPAAGEAGFVHGASDKNGMFPADAPVKPDDLAATMYYLLGIDPHAEVSGPGGRPVFVTDGKPVMNVIA
jgi:hypothetical protein